MTGGEIAVSILVALLTTGIGAYIKSNAKNAADSLDLKFKSADMVNSVRHDKVLERVDNTAQKLNEVKTSVGHISKQLAQMTTQLALLAQKQETLEKKVASDNHGKVRVRE